MRKFIINIGIVGSLALILFYALDVVFTKIYQEGSFYKTQWLFQINKQSYDYAILGASRSYTALDVGEINHQTDLNGINLSLDGSFISTQSLILDVFLSNQNNINTLYLNIDGWQLDYNTESQFTYPRFLPYVENDLVYNHFVQLDKKWYLYRYVPFMRYAEFNFTWGLHMLVNNLLGFIEPDFDEFGTRIYKFTDYRGEREVKHNLFKTQGEFKYLNRIIETCNEKNIELVTFVPPIATIKRDTIYYENIASFEKWIESKGVKFYNFGDLYPQQYELYTDEIHLNKYGVEKFSKVFSSVVDSSDERIITSLSGIQ